MATRDSKSSRTSASQKVEAFILKAILEGRLKPRERIIEDDVARSLGCSRGPVREAVLRLERDGLIVTTPRRGTFVRDLSPQEVEVVFSIRGKLEALAVRYLREAQAPDTESTLRKCLQTLKGAAKKDDEAFLQADMNLHHTIWKLSGQPQLYRTLRFVMNPLFFMVARVYSRRSFATLEGSYKNHEEYLDIVLTTPPSKVEREVEQYFRKLYERLDETAFPHLYVPAGGTRQAWNEMNFD